LGEQEGLLRADGESRRLATGAFLALGLAAAFYLFFQLTKQIPALAAVNASGNDPYDAIGSFGIQAAAFFGLLSVVRCFWWSRGGRELSAQDRLLIVRSGMAAVLAVGITLAGDLIAMLRHPAVWTGSSAGLVYAASLGVIVALDASVGIYVGWASLDVRGPRSPRAWSWAGLSVLVFVAVLALYPESLRAGVGAALFTILVGVMLLFWPMRLLLVVLLPTPTTPVAAVASGRRFAARWLPWATVAVAGAAVGLLLLSAEMFKESGGTAPPLAQLLRVAAVYLGIETVGLLAGFALLREPVGLTSGESPNNRFERTA
jgi:hypothetical protein